MNKGTLRWFNLVIILVALLVYQGVALGRSNSQKQQLISGIKAINVKEQENVTATDSQVNSENSTEAASTVYNNGTYEGEGDGFGGKIKVKVTLENDSIKSVKVTDHRGEGDAYYSQASVLTDQIVENQSTDLDTISGATFSSEGILSAVDDALGKAEK